MSDFTELLDEAGRHPTRGWDFTWLGERMTTEPLPWDFVDVMVPLARESPDLLDLGTGGGEWLASLPNRPARTVATEAWPPNLSIARDRLQPLGVEVVEVEGAPDNNRQFDVVDDYPGLPFDDHSFHLVCSRHESFIAREVARVLCQGGRFATQQVGDGLYREVRALFGVVGRADEPLDLALVGRQVSEAGLEVVESNEGVQLIHFRDVGALAWYLRMVPWTLPGFSITSQRVRLKQLHERIETDGPLAVAQTGLYLVAVRA